MTREIWDCAKRIAVCLAVLLLSACSYTLQYNESYLAAARRPVTIRADGKAAIYTTPADDAFVFSDHPTSLTGNATTASVPLGVIVREAARVAFEDVFRDGVDKTATLTAARDYRVIVNPRPTKFEYQYNQLRNIGFAITPIVNMTVDVRVLDARGDAVWHREYVSGEVLGSTYMVNLKPEEEINRTTHAAAYQLMAKAASDIVSEVLTARSADIAR
jgi:hypothetical protein